jgi:predicted AAA+ superfamily ATPase
MKRKIEEKLIAWRNKADRMPLILNGARQVGKTYTLREFGEKNYKNTIYVNLELNQAVSSYFGENITPDKIIRYLEATYNEYITPGETLIILDEIQTCERALTALKYFREDAPEYHIACAGSLLGVAINRQNYSFPVGKVETLTMYPLDLEEFLLANNEDLLCGEILNCYQSSEPLPEALHQKALDFYRLYLITGGMPACVKAFIQTGKLLDIPNIQGEILDNYISDMAKYANNSDSVKIRACYNSIPAQLAKDNRKFQYKVVQNGGTATIFGVSIEWLQLSGVVLKCQKTEHGTDPIPVYADLSSFKLYMGDVGLLVTKSGLSHQIILSDGDNIFMGAVTENYVAQQLAANGHHLYYWESGNSAEIDFVLQSESDVIAIEVKKGVNTKSKSLGVCIGRYKPSRAIRISAKNFGKTEQIISIPLYAVWCLRK